MIYNKVKIYAQYIQYVDFNLGVFHAKGYGQVQSIPSELSVSKYCLLASHS
jgi:hypothetical protein